MRRQYDAADGMTCFVFAVIIILFVFAVCVI